MMLAKFLSPLTDRQKRGIEDATGFVGLLAFVSELSLQVVPATEFVSVLPAACELRDGTPVHEARNAFEIGLVRRGVCHVLELLPVGHLELHETSPAFRVGHDSTAVAIAVDFLGLLPACFVGELDRGGVGQLGLDLLAVSTRFLLVRRLRLLPLTLILGLDASVVRLVLGRKFGLRIGSNFTRDIARLSALLVTEDEISVGIAIHHHRDAVELLLRREVALLGEPDHLLDSVDDEAVVSVRLSDFHRSRSFLLWNVQY